MNSMREAKISCSVIQPVATSPSQVIHINDSAININSRFKSSGIISFGAMHPELEDYDSELRRISKSGIKGIKLHPVYQNMPVDDARYIRILECAGKYDLWVMIHAGYDIGYPGNENAMPEKILRAMKSSGNERVILAHMGGWRCWHKSLELFADTHAYIDTAFSLGSFTPNNDGYYSRSEECMMLCADEFVKMIHAFGAERVLFGSDSPWASQTESVMALSALPLSESEKRKIFYENARSILRLNE
ncbi:MAG: amidohydrolase family protein [Synergistaceae bacterium]|nr:amidohydrolase family protein [Synergistaceae bacterium]MBQ3449217.1 amidohydrolase family protein [Synergistaceae bacterium]MBQ3693824.1 amidohydrolase family protein [Synergistaceae bacterium]MBQ9627652.1 amidohydrolase family protein [Synergistaceae bacterium]MBR0069575.1 amidohydrolase family protein [Synergistaceae bacterium]